MKHHMYICGVFSFLLPIRRDLLSSLPLFLLLPLLWSCIAEELEGCPVGMELQLEYTFNPSNEDKFAQSVQGGEFFLYDADGQLLQRRSLTSTEIASARMPLKLAPGSYTCVLWGNWQPADYRFTAEGTLKGMKLSLIEQDGRVENRPQPLFHASAELEIKPQTPAKHRLSLRKSTNVIHVILEGAMSGVQPTRDISSGTSYGMTLTGSNGVYNHDNTPATGRELTYFPDYIRFVPGYKNALGADFTVMRLWKGDDMRLFITNGTQVMVDRPLTEMLMQSDKINTDDDLDRYDEYTLRFDSNYMLTGIKVDDWTEVGQSGGGI